MVELKKTFVIYLTDIDPDTGFVSQMKPVAYTEKEGYAKEITKFLNSEKGDGEDPTRTYKYQEL